MARVPVLVLAAIFAIFGILVVAPTAAAAPSTMVALGDSITWGVVRSGLPNGPPMERDPAGGYPGRLAAILAPDERILNRGLSASATEDWLGRPLAIAPGPMRALLEATWPDFRPGREPAADEKMVDYVRATDRPTVALVLLGVNDFLRARMAGRPAEPAAIAARVGEIAARLRAAGAIVLVATLPPNQRDTPAELAATNERLLAHDPDCVRLDLALQPTSGLPVLGDEIHPSAWGHALIARAFAHALKARGLARPRALPPR